MSSRTLFFSKNRNTLTKSTSYKQEPDNSYIYKIIYLYMCTIICAPFHDTSVNIRSRRRRRVCTHAPLVDFINDSLFLLLLYAMRYYTERERTEEPEDDARPFEGHRRTERRHRKLSAVRESQRRLTPCPASKFIL